MSSAGSPALESVGVVVPDEVESEQLAPSEIKRRALIGTLLLSGRGMALQVVAFGAMIAIARLLTPGQVGEWAVGRTVAFLLAFVAGGQALAGALIRSPAAPDRTTLRALLGFELVVTTLIAVPAAMIAWNLGEIGRLAALMIVPLPLEALRTPAYVVMERNLSYKGIATAETIETVAYYAWILATVGAGWSVWGLASGTIVRTVVGVAVVLVMSPVRLVVPTFRWGRVRPLLRLGLQIQAMELTETAGSEGLNLGAAGIAGLPVLGLWTIARRPLQVPTLLYQSVMRVSFPAMSRLVASEDDPRPVIERAMLLGALGCGMLLTPIAVASPTLVSIVFGSKWSGVASVLPPACLGLLISVPVSLALNGYLWAIGDGKTPLLAALGNTVAWLGVGFALLPVIGAPALGVGLLAGSIVTSSILRLGTARHIKIHFFAPLAGPLCVSLIAGGLGWLLAMSQANVEVATLVGALSSEALFVAGVMLLNPQLVGELRAFFVARRSIEGETTPA
jgi:O-antigen/teichoic acid export membrane protein